MNIWDYSILAAVGLMLLLAVLRMRKKKKTGCPGCCACCSGACPEPQRKETHESSKTGGPYV